MNNLGKSIVIAAAIFSASHLLSNLHSTRVVNGGVFVVNNATGSVRACDSERCFIPKLEE